MAQASQPIESHLVNAGDAFSRAGLVHRVRAPTTPAPHPAVIMLHGLAGDENAMWIFARTLPADWLLISPRAILPDAQRGFTWCAGSSEHLPAPLEQFDAAAHAIAQLARALPAVYAADPARVYLMGFSQGAAAAYAAALRYPGLTSGIAALLGFMPAAADEPLRYAFHALPIFMAVGQRDPRIPLAYAQANAAALRQAGALLEYHAYDARHKLPSSGLQDLTQWWLKISRANI